jgi:hypothetical protein
MGGLPRAKHFICGRKIFITLGAGRTPHVRNGDIILNLITIF